MQANVKLVVAANNWLRELPPPCLPMEAGIESDQWGQIQLPTSPSKDGLRADGAGERSVGKNWGVVCLCRAWRESCLLYTSDAADDC